MFKKVSSSLTFVVALATTLNFSHGEVYGMEIQEKNRASLISNNYEAGKISFGEHVIARQRKHNSLMADRDLYRFMKNPERFVKKPAKPKISKKTILETQYKKMNPLMADNDLYRFMKNPEEFVKETTKTENSENDHINIIATSDNDSDIDSGEAPNDLLALNNSKKRKWS